jgi:hypothetical protein
VHLVRGPGTNQPFIKDPRHLSESEVGEWNDLEARAAVANPFFGPNCAVPAARHLAEECGAYLLGVRDSAGLRAILPIQEVSSRRAILRVAVGHSRGLSTAVGLGVPLLDPEGLSESLDGLIEAMVRWAKGAGPSVVVLDWFDEGSSAVGSALRDACRARRIPVWVQRTWERPVVTRVDGQLSLTAAMSSKRRYEMRRRQRRLEEDLGGSVELLDRAGDPRAVEEFMELESSGWKGTDGDAYALAPAKAAWFREMCAQMAQSNRLNLLSLVVQGRTVAMQCHLRSGREAFLLRVAHDASLDKYGLGVLLHALAVDHLAALEVDVVDTCASPSDEFLGDLYPGRRSLSTLVLGTGGLGARSLVTAAARASRRRAPSTP